MNLATLKGVCAAFHDKEPADLIQGSVDLFLVAANNARSGAEMDHDFEYTRTTASLAIDGVTGASLDDAVFDQPGVFAGVKSILDVSALRANGVYVPVPFSRADVAIERDRTEIELSGDEYPSDNRYPSDADFLRTRGTYGVVQRGKMLYRFPRVSVLTPGETNPIPLYLECYGWLKEYTSAQLEDYNATAQDFILDVGFDFLQWSIIIELNYKYHTFVPRQEGNVGSPEKMQKESWNSLIQWDSYLIDPQSTRSR